MNFLTGKWEHLVFANYSIEPDVLRQYVPRHTRVDQFEEKTYVSLVAFMFNQTRVLGLPIPFHRSFEEVNLRFYVRPEKDPSIRAVTFIKELVPRRFIPWIANGLFNENYSAVKMAHGQSESVFWYAWGATGRTQMISDRRSFSIELSKVALDHVFAVDVPQELKYPEQGTLAEFITEHYWGYAKGRRKTIEYQVQHPQWKCCCLDRFQIDIDFGLVYGAEFAFLNDRRPDSVLYARGSDIGVSMPSFYG